MDYNELILIINQFANAITSIAMIVAVPCGSIAWAIKKWKAKPHLTKDQKKQLKQIKQIAKENLIEENKNNG